MVTEAFLALYHVYILLSLPQFGKVGMLMDFSNRFTELGLCLFSRIYFTEGTMRIPHCPIFPILLNCAIYIKTEITDAFSVVITLVSCIGYE